MAPARQTSELSSLPTVAGKADNLTQEGTILGTLPYMAPEQADAIAVTANWLSLLPR